MQLKRDRLLTVHAYVQDKSINGKGVLARVAQTCLCKLNADEHTPRPLRAIWKNLSCDVSRPGRV